MSNRNCEVQKRESRNKTLQYMIPIAIIAMLIPLLFLIIPGMISPTASFDPVIDGNIDPSEHWELAENVHGCYLTADSTHTTDYNYLYASRSEDYLYIAVDLCSDTTNDTDGEWIMLSLDTDNSQDAAGYLPDGGYVDPDDLLFEYTGNLFTSFTEWYNNWRIENGTEMIAYNVSSGETYLNRSIYVFGNEFVIPFNSTANYTVEFSFDISVNSDIPHRMFEFNITLADLNNMTVDGIYGLSVLGYGTFITPPPSYDESAQGFYAIPQGATAIHCAQVLMWPLFVQGIGGDETGWDFPNRITTTFAISYLLMNERYYFLCGNTTVHETLDNSYL